MGVAAAAGIGVVGAVGSAAIGSHAAHKAAKQQAAAADRATELQMKMYQQTRSDLAPFMQGGSQAFSQLAKIFGFAPQPQPAGTTATSGTQGTFVTGPDGNPVYVPPQETQNGMLAPNTSQPDPAFATELLTKFPGYQFGKEQGQLGLDRAAAAGGRVLSGAQLRDSAQFGTDYAMSQAWAPFISELNWATGIGANAAAGLGTEGSRTAAGMAETQVRAGDANAAGTVGAANAWGSAVQQLPQIFSSFSRGSGSGSPEVYAPPLDIGPTTIDPSIFTPLGRS